jgi:hypothetical protein
LLGCASLDDVLSLSIDKDYISQEGESQEQVKADKERGYSSLLSALILGLS